VRRIHIALAAALAVATMDRTLVGAQESAPPSLSGAANGREPKPLCQPSRSCAEGIAAIAALTPPKDPIAPDPETFLRRFAERLTGPNPRDCGQRWQDQGFAQWRGTEYRPTAAEQGKQQDGSQFTNAQQRCATESSDARIPFWTVTGGVRTDYFAAEGLVGASDGSLLFFYLAASPFGSTLETRRCLRLSATRLDCDLWSADPPMRVHVP
jgi:hypothetical protein